MATKLLSRNRKSRDPSTDEKKLLDWGNRLVEDGRASRRALEAQWWENIATYCGDFWVDFDVHTNKLVEPARPDHRVRLPVNLVQPAVRTEYAKLLKNRPLVDCLARSNDQADLHAAEVGDKLLYNYVEKQLHMPRYRRRMLQWVVICGTGGLFVDYDPRAVGERDVLVDPQGNPIFDQRMIAAIQKYYRNRKRAPKTIKIRQGELRHVALSPFQLLWDQSKLEYDDAWWCIISEVFDVDEVFVRWNKEIEGDKNAAPGIIERRTLQQWDLTNKLEWQRGDTQRLAEVHRLFVRPGHRYFPDGAEVVFTNNEIIDKTNFPFRHGMLPIGITGHVPAPWSRHSFSVVPQVKPLALEVSKTVSQMIENRNLIGNPPWMEYKQNRIQGEIQNKPGMRLTIDWHPNVPEPHPIQMPEIPQYVQALVPIMKETIQEVTGQSEVSQGKVPAGARAGVTIAYLQEEDDTKLGPTVQEYEECIERVSWLDLQVIAEKYDAPRTIRIYRKHSDPEVFDFIGTMLEGVAGVVCQAGSALPRSKAAKQQFILDLWDRKIEQDPRRVRQWLELNEGDPDEFEEDINEAERENRKLMQGTSVEVKEWQNHAAHHYKHRQLMKSAQWDELQANTQQMIEAHDEDHSNFERQAASQQMVQQMMAGGGGGGGGGGPAPPPTGGSNGNNAAPAPQFSGNGNGFAPPEDGQTGSPASFSPQ